MEGFNLIPKDNSTTVEIPTNQPSVRPVIVGAELSAAKQVSEKKPADIIFWVTILAVVAALGFVVYVVAMRFILLSQITGVSQELQQFQASINKSQIEDLKTVDQRLRMINSRLSSHILSAVVLDNVNKQLRNSTQISEYKIDVTDNDLQVTLAIIAPTFKDMAEQTEKLFEAKDQGLIKNFAITNMAYEQDTRRVRFTLKLSLDKLKYSAAGIKITKQN
jgi:hypothetical protein